MSDESDAIWNALIAYEEQTFRARASGISSLVHYTSFAGLKGILDTEELWFSSASTTNDFQEISRGKSMLERMSAAEGQPLFDIIKSIRDLNPDVWDALNDNYKCRHFGDLFHTYISCWSECDFAKWTHDNLTMWRGYAADGNGVAIVIDALKLVSGATMPSEVVMCPVFYESEVEFALRAQAAFKLFREGMLTHRDQIPNNIALTANAFGEICFYLAVTHKHWGFAPEREWRFAWSKHRDPSDEGLRRHLRPALANGDLVEKFCLPIRSDPAISQAEISIRDLLQSVMVGPCPDIVLKRDAVVSLLKSKGLLNAEQLVAFTEIPYRSVR